METETASNNIKETEKVTIEVNDFKRSNPLQNDDDDDDIPLPGELVRKKSKQEAEQEMNLQDLIIKYATNLSILRSKLPPPHLSCRNLRSINTLRKA